MRAGDLGVAHSRVYRRAVFLARLPRNLGTHPDHLLPSIVRQGSSYSDARSDEAVSPGLLIDNVMCHPCVLAGARSGGGTIVAGAGMANFACYSYGLYSYDLYSCGLCTVVAHLVRAPVVMAPAFMACVVAGAGMVCLFCLQRHAHSHVTGKVR